MALQDYKGLQTNDNTTDAGGIALDNNFSKIADYYYLQNYLNNSSFELFQRQTPSSATSRADDTYGPDRWYTLNQSNPVNISRTTLGSSLNSYYYCVQSQANATPQRMGLAQIIPVRDATIFKGRKARFQIQLNLSSSANVRYAILEWTGTANSVTSDVVNDWTSSTYTTGNFFNSTTLAVVGVGSTALTANTWTACAVEGSVSTSVSNLIVFAWTESTVAQNVTLNYAEAQLVSASTVSAATGMLPYKPKNLEAELNDCQYYYQKNCDYDTVMADGFTQNESYAGVVDPTTTTRLFTQMVQFYRPMRTSPSLTFYRSANGSSAGKWAYFNGTSYTDSSAVSGNQSVMGMRVDLTTGSLTAFRGYIIKGGYTADADL
jgi:hypothetical protein